MINMHCFLAMNNQFVQLPDMIYSNNPEGQEISVSKDIETQIIKLCSKETELKKEEELLKSLYTYTPKDVDEHLMLKTKHNEFKNEYALLNNEKELVCQRIVADWLKTGTILKNDSDEYLFVFEYGGMRVVKKLVNVSVNKPAFLLERHRDVFISDSEYLFDVFGVRYKIVYQLDCSNYEEAIAYLPEYIYCKEEYEAVQEEMQHINNTITKGYDYDFKVNRYKQLIEKSKYLNGVIAEYEKQLIAFVEAMLEYNDYHLEQGYEVDYCE